MFGLGMGELLVILALALLLLGPKRLPDIASGLGKAIRDFRRATQDIQSQIEVDETVGKPLAELRSALTEAPRPLPRAEPLAPPAETVAAAAPILIPASVPMEAAVVHAGPPQTQLAEPLSDPAPALPAPSAPKA